MACCVNRNNDYGHDHQGKGESGAATSDREDDHCDDDDDGYGDDDKPLRANDCDTATGDEDDDYGAVMIRTVVRGWRW